MKRVSRFNGSKVLQAHTRKLRQRVANVTTYTDNDSVLLDGTQYYYKVCATNSAGDSAFSNEVNGITTHASPDRSCATAVSSSQINLTWTDNSLAENGYRIEQSPVDNLHYHGDCGHRPERNFLQCYRSQCRDEVLLQSPSLQCDYDVRI